MQKSTYVGLRNQDSICNFNRPLQYPFFTPEFRETIPSCNNVGDSHIMYHPQRQRQEMTGNSSPPDTEEIIQCFRMNNGEPAGPSAESMGNFDTGDTSSQGASPAHETQMSWERENAAMQEGGSLASSRSASPVQLSSDPRKGTYVGLRNQGSTCYLNSLLQCLFFTRELRRVILSCDNYDSSIVCQLKKLFQELKRNKSVPSTERITKCLGVRDVHQQQDVVEYFRILMNKIIEDKEAIQQLYQVEMVHSITCHGCKHQTRIKEDPVLSLALSLDKCKSEAYSVCKALAAVQKVNEFTGDEQFYCETCQSKQDATSHCYFETLPQILVLNLKRYQFDGNQFKKLCYEVSVPFSLTVNSEEQPNTQYELFAICHHSGGIYGGHYVAEIKSFENDCWYYFDDTTVQEERNSTGAKNSPTAYLLMYRMAAGDAKPNRNTQIGFLQRLLTTASMASEPAPAAPAKLMQEAQPEPEIQPSASVESSSQSTETLLSSESHRVRSSQSSQPCKKLVSPASGTQFQAEQEADESLKGAWMAAQNDPLPLSSSKTSRFVMEGGLLDTETLSGWHTKDWHPQRQLVVPTKYREKFLNLA
nr:ubiquitin carboxyl-terminal hydrolase 47-like isoform X2 [Chelonoidis abingdonii]